MSANSLLLHYRKKCNRIHFFTETVEQICNACSNVIVVTKQEILVISLTVFFSAASRRNNDVILTSFSVYLFTVSVNLVYMKL